MALPDSVQWALSGQVRSLSESVRESEEQVARLTGALDGAQALLEEQIGMRDELRAFMKENR